MLTAKVIEEGLSPSPTETFEAVKARGVEGFDKNG
jgi:hypothetical protein